MAPESTQLLTRIAGGAIIAFFGAIAGGLLQYVYYIIIGRCLGTESLGLFTLGLMAIGIAIAASRFGIETGITKFVSGFRAQREFGSMMGVLHTAFRIVILSGLITGILLFVFSYPLSLYAFQKPDVSEVLKILSLSIPILALLGLAFSICQSSYFAMYGVSVQNIIFPLSSIIFFFLYYIKGEGVRGLAASYVMGGAVSLIIMAYILKRILSEYIHIESVPFKNKDLLKYSIPIALTSLLDQIILWADVIVLGVYRPASEIGIYNAAVRSSMLLLSVIVSFNFLLAPSFAELHQQQERKKLEGMLKDVARWTATVSLPIFFLMAYFAVEIAKFFGDEFAAAAQPMIILLAGQLINNISGSVGTLLLMTGRSRLTLINSIICAAANIALNYILVPVYGIIGAAYGTAASIILINSIRIVEVYMILGIHPFSFKYLKPFYSFIAGIGFVGLMSLSRYGNGEYPVIIIFGFPMVYLLALLFMGIEKTDYAVIREIKRQIKASYV